MADQANDNRRNDVLSIALMVVVVAAFIAGIVWIASLMLRVGDLFSG